MGAAAAAANLLLAFNTPEKNDDKLKELQSDEFKNRVNSWIYLI